MLANGESDVSESANERKGQSFRSASSPIQSLMHAVPSISLVQPENITSPMSFSAALPASARSILEVELAKTKQQTEPAGNPTLESQFRLATPSTSPASPEGFDTTTADEASHDVFFNVSRSRSGGVNEFIASVLQVRKAFHTDIAQTRTSLSSLTLAELDGSLLSALSLLFDFSPALGQALAVSSLAETDESAAYRWINGHHIFAILSQSLILGFNALEEAAASEDVSKLSNAAQHISIFLQASAISMYYTADFAPERYDALIRPSMAPPFMSENFSGLLSKDHKHLVRRMKDCRPAIEFLEQTSPEQHKAIYSALAEVYDAHKLVCSKFVGASSPSLLKTGSECASAMDQLDRFKANRLKFVAPATTP